MSADVKGGVQVNVLCGKAAYTAKFDTIAHHHRSMQSTLFTGYRQPVCVVHTNACICERTHTLYTQNRPDLESQFGIRRPIILMIFLFALYHSLLLVFLLSILAVSMCTFCGFHDKKKKMTPLLWERKCHISPSNL